MQPTRIRWSMILCFAALLGDFPVAAAEPKPQSPVPPAAKVEQVVVVFKTHFDIGYTQLAREVVERYRTTMIDKALAVCDASEKLPPENRFVWTIPGWPMQQILWPGQTPERRGRIEKAIREGRLVWHALGGTTHTESMGLEDLVRSLGFSSRLARQFNQPLPRDAKMTDVPCHTWVVPTVLKRAGVDFLHLGCNSASGSPDVPVLFWWEGPDGSRLLTMYTAEGYGTDLKPPANWPHKTWLALIHTGDNHGPPEPGEVQQLLDRARKELPGVKIRMGRLSDFGDAILAEEKQRPTLPVIRKDMPDTWIHGILSMPQEAAMIRRVRPQMAAMESLHTLLSAWGRKQPAIDKTLEAAYEGSFLYSEHTWGASSREYSPRVYGAKWQEARSAGKYRYAEESWREHAEYAGRAVRETVPRLDAEVQALARAVGVQGPRIVVYNPLPWSRDAAVTVSGVRAQPFLWKDLETGESLLDRRSGDTFSFVLRKLPAMGYRTLVPKTNVEMYGIAVPSGPQIMSRFFHVKFDPDTGMVQSIVDSRRGKELVERGGEYRFGDYLYERFDKDFHLKFLEDYCKKPLPGWADEFGRSGLPPASEVRYAAARPQRYRLKLRHDGFRSDAELIAEPAAGVPHRVRLRVSVFEHLPWIDLEWQIEGKRADPWPEAGWLVLPLAVDRPQFRLGRPGSIVDPAQDAARGSNFEMFSVDSGLTVTGPDGQGVGICPIDTPLVSLGRSGAFRYTREFGTRKPIVLVNVLNNIWGTNFQQWIEGGWTCRVRIWSVAGKGPEEDLVTPGWEARTPCPAAYADGPAGPLPPTKAGVELSRKGVLITAFGPNPDGEGTLLRLWEQSGQDGVCRVRLPEGLRQAKAQPCDLRGRPGGAPLEVRDGVIEVPLTHFAPSSVLLME